MQDLLEKQKFQIKLSSKGGKENVLNFSTLTIKQFNVDVKSFQNEQTKLLEKKEVSQEEYNWNLNKYYLWVAMQPKSKEQFKDEFNKFSDYLDNTVTPAVGSEFMKLAGEIINATLGATQTDERLKKNTTEYPTERTKTAQMVISLLYWMTILIVINGLITLPSSIGTASAWIWNLLAN